MFYVNVRYLMQKNVGFCWHVWEQVVRLLRKESLPHIILEIRSISFYLATMNC